MINFMLFYIKMSRDVGGDFTLPLHTFNVLHYGLLKIQVNLERLFDLSIWLLLLLEEMDWRENLNTFSMDYKFIYQNYLPRYQTAFQLFHQELTSIILFHESMLPH